MDSGLMSAATTNTTDVSRTGTALCRTNSLCTISETNSNTPIVNTSVTNTVTISNTISNAIPTSSAGTLITTTDAYTITDGPAIFLTEDPLSVGKFYIQQANIPKKTLDQLLERIENNNTIQSKIAALEKTIEDKLGADADKEKKMERENYNPEVKRLMSQVDQLRTEIKSATMDACYIPNTRQHQYIWTAETWREKNAEMLKHGFIPTIENQTVRDIMELNVEPNMKLLLMLGIGVFITTDTRYLEIMKRMAYEQKLYLIIASGDYIYGTNYQFAHGFLGKDLTAMTQQKTIQAMGRIGRGTIQQDYTIRFRDDTILRGLFLPQASNPEADMMSKLMS